MAIDCFRGEFNFLSNFYASKVSYEGLIFPSVENAYQAAKFKKVSDRLQFLTCSPSEAKKLGKGVTEREDWQSFNMDLMYDLIKQKFSPGTRFAERLINTNSEEIIEGNTWGDTYWGVCGGVGENHLGKILMRVREELRQS